ncbi:hypothetical protein PFI31113_00860 [Pandoraea fibrosis]|uniref:Uncharacterized protein n=1 Tax=Pandoraea fibrosis TaxID=1891094 RepID=A0A5E4SKG0_9BURK|nr:hypothetical protein PFI31113_00860 [Pandoraea fibrosis]
MSKKTKLERPVSGKLPSLEAIVGIPGFAR